MADTRKASPLTFGLVKGLGKVLEFVFEDNLLKGKQVNLVGSLQIRVLTGGIKARKSSSVRGARSFGGVGRQ